MMAHRGQIPIVRIGRRVQYDRHAIDNWIKEHAQ
jgi:hypothetical protein